jgi:hypothetical protein
VFRLAATATSGRGLALLARAERADLVRAIASAVLPAVAMFSLTLGCVMLLNRIHYGVYETNEFHSQSFKRAYGALARVRHERWERYTVFPADARKQAYAHSAAARELEPFFEGPDAARWRAIGCEQTGTSPCPEILSGWFMWALREAVAQTGHYRDAAEALRFYDRLADEIGAACEAKKIDCLPPRATLAPPFRWHYITDMAGPVALLARFVLRMGEGSVGSAPSTGSPTQLRFFMDWTGGRLSATADAPLVSGWVASRSPLTQLAAYDAAGRVAHTALEYTPGPDAAAANPGLFTSRFSMATRCDVHSCVLRARAGPDSLETPLRTGGFRTAGGTLKVYIDSLGGNQLAGPTERRQRLQQRYARAVARAYAATFPYLTLAAGAGLLLAFARPGTRRAHWALIALACACLAAVATRIVLLAYLDATSIPSANGSYATPASALHIVFVVLGLWLGATTLGARSTPFRRGDPLENQDSTAACR